MDTFSWETNTNPNPNPNNYITMDCNIWTIENVFIYQNNNFIHIPVYMQHNLPNCHVCLCSSEVAMGQ